jgi:hemolysin activation/secretion protein
LAYVDNWGNRDTGRVEYGVQAAANNFSDNGDTLNVGGVTSGHGLKGYVLGYDAWLGPNGLRFAVKHSRVKYALGDTSPEATGQVTTVGYSVSYPFVRGRSFSLYGTLGYDSKQLLDDNPNIGMHFPRTIGLWNLGLSGDFADSFGGGGKNGFSLVYYRGKLSITDAEALVNDSDKTNGDFAKAVLSYQREQYLAENINFYMSFTGQAANKNLDSSEKLFIDGPEGVRAFPQGDVSGDQGYKVTGEFRWRLPGWSNTQNDCFLNLFYDYGSVIISKRPSSAGLNRRSLMGTGLGLLWMMKPDYTVRLDYAWKIGRDEAADNGRLWLQVNRYY